jgi:hypothetical protein
MKKVLVATFALALVLARAPSAFADPAKASSASAYGLSATLLGSQLIGPTPTALAAQPPDKKDGPNTVIGLPLPPLAIDGTISAEATAHKASDIKVTDANPLGVPGESDPTSLNDVNAKGLSRTEGLGVVVQGPLDVTSIPLPDLIGQTLVTATAVEGEAVAKCVGGVAQFDYGYDIVGLGLAGQEIPLASDVLAALTNLLGPNFAAADLLHVETPDNSPSTTVIKTADGISVTALRVVSDILGIDIPIGHAEARMPGDCRLPQCSDTIDNDGDGKIDFGPDPGCDSPQDDDERDRIQTGAPALAATGGDMGAWPLMAFGALGGVVILRRMKLRASSR